MLRVWVDGKSVGTLNRFKTRGSTFAYDPATAPGLAVSVTMPSRTASWDTIDGLAPIFAMNLPEGVLRERLMRQFAKTLGSFDDFDLLGLVGKTQIGRLRYSGFAEPLSEDVPFQSIEEILESKGTSELFDYLIEKFAIHSGLSGVQPKVMIRAEEGSGLRLSSSFKSATHIVKFWDAAEYPELAANEFFCLQIARRLKFAVPQFSLSQSGQPWLSDVSILQPMADISDSRIFVCSMAFLHPANTTEDTKPDFLGARGNSFARSIGQKPLPTCSDCSS
jgi:serine/threonine-protein kinase HipA